MLYETVHNRIADSKAKTLDCEEQSLKGGKTFTAFLPSHIIVRNVVSCALSL